MATGSRLPTAEAEAKSGYLFLDYPDEEGEDEER